MTRAVPCIASLCCFSLVCQILALCCSNFWLTLLSLYSTFILSSAYSCFSCTSSINLCTGVNVPMHISFLSLSLPGVSFAFSCPSSQFSVFWVLMFSGSLPYSWFSVAGCLVRFTPYQKYLDFITTSVGFNDSFQFFYSVTAYVYLISCSSIFWLHPSIFSSDPWFFHQCLGVIPSYVVYCSSMWKQAPK